MSLKAESSHDFGVSKEIIIMWTIMLKSQAETNYK